MPLRTDGPEKPKVCTCHCLPGKRRCEPKTELPMRTTGLWVVVSPAWAHMHSLLGSGDLSGHASLACHTHQWNPFSPLLALSFIAFPVAFTVAISDKSPSAFDLASDWSGLYVHVCMTKGSEACELMPCNPSDEFLLIHPKESSRKLTRYTLLSS